MLLTPIFVQWGLKMNTSRAAAARCGKTCAWQPIYLLPGWHAHHRSLAALGGTMHLRGRVVSSEWGLRRHAATDSAIATCQTWPFCLQAGPLAALSAQWRGLQTSASKLATAAGSTDLTTEYEHATGLEK